MPQRVRKRGADRLRHKVGKVYRPGGHGVLSPAVDLNDLGLLELPVILLQTLDFEGTLVTFFMLVIGCD